jgi:hypothetical protein
MIVQDPYPDPMFFCGFTVCIWTFLKIVLTQKFLLITYICAIAHRSAISFACPETPLGCKSLKHLNGRIQFQNRHSFGEIGFGY